MLAIAGLLACELGMPFQSAYSVELPAQLFGITHGQPTSQASSAGQFTEVEQNTQKSDPGCDQLSDLGEVDDLTKRLKNCGLLYKSDSNPYVQELWFLGRYHGQSYNAAGNAGDSDDWEIRRFRIGSQLQCFQRLTLHAQMVSGADMYPFYNGFTELWTQWSFHKVFAITVGQQKHRFTHDRNVSSRYLNTLERSMLVNMFGLDYTPAVTASGNIERLSYYTGVFSNATSRDMWNSFTEFDSGYSLLCSGTLDLGDRLGTDQAFWNLGYLYSDANSNATNLNRFTNGCSTALILTQGPRSLISELLLGIGGAYGDGFGINIQPGVFLSRSLQLASRYQFAISDQDNSLVAQRRYEQPAGLTSGDLYNAGYLGLNYYLAGHRAKLMSGLEYANLSGQDVWTFSVALRLFWGPNASGPFPIDKMLQ
ncbi:MAG: hypothetical protein KF752_02565 [Pirellulaceae bacterium]|nr:hypothetical protein [Pirellulaceae bacterium]